MTIKSFFVKLAAAMSACAVLSCNAALDETFF